LSNVLRWHNQEKSLLEDESSRDDKVILLTTVDVSQPWVTIVRNRRAKPAAAEWDILPMKELSGIRNRHMMEIVERLGHGKEAVLAHTGCNCNQ